MTQRPYYDDAYTTTFPANVTRRFTHDGHPAVLLDISYFYPTSGGQPYDTGTLIAGDEEWRVVEVLESADKRDVIHIVDAMPDKPSVVAHVDWARRFDHMQHHTGQHILSQAFIRVAEAETIGFHLSDQSVTIDLDHADLTEATIAGAELLTNQIIWEDRLVSSRQIPLAEARSLSLRKIPEGKDGRLRVVEIEEFDRTACGGTHVRRTGEIGQLKIVRADKHRDGLRIEFRCGLRALTDHHQKTEVLSQLTSRLTTGLDDLVHSVERLQAELKESRAIIKKQQTALLAEEARGLLASAISLGPDQLITSVLEERTADELGQLGKLLSEEPHTIALLGLAGERSMLLFSRSDDAGGSMQSLLQAALAALGDARGGGNDRLARGGGPPRTRAAMEQAIDTAVGLLRAETNQLE